MVEAEARALEDGLFVRALAVGVTSPRRGEATVVRRAVHTAVTFAVYVPLEPRTAAGGGERR